MRRQGHRALDDCITAGRCARDKHSEPEHRQVGERPEDSFPSSRVESGSFSCGFGV